MTNTVLRYFTAGAVSLLSILEPTISFAFILFFAIILDCASAYDLSRRLKKKYPDKVQGKFQSHYALKMFKTFFQAYSVIVLLHLVDKVILRNIISLNLSNFGAALFCGIQLWSILENISSGNGARWAKIAQKIMVDKTKRHLDIDLNEYEKDSTTNAN